LHNGGIMYDLDSLESAKWLHSSIFLAHFGDQASCMKVHTYSTLAEFVPIACNSDSHDYLRFVEGNNNLDPGVIEEAHWIKAPERRTKGQKVAHLILRFNSPQAANRAVRDGLIIASKSVSVRKLICEPRRCLKCQKIAAPHIAKDCKQIHDTCANCASISHKTAECEVDLTDFKCCNCTHAGRTVTDHAAWDCDCPVFQEHCHHMKECQSESRYHFFPTVDPSSW
ncbi:hypothetical protein BKA93DRAFT_693639, partial [Sparassis latifolia]